MWSLNSKQTKRVQIRTKDREEAEKSIRLKNHQKIRKAVICCFIIIFKELFNFF
jgi:hypothetical protein